MTPKISKIVDAVNNGEDVDVEHLTFSERWMIVRALGWDKTMSTTYLLQWCGGKEPKAMGTDYEGLILSEQEEDESRWG